MENRAVLYARVSTDNQADNYSLPTQLEACQKYAVQHSFEVVAEITDDVSGSIPVSERPGGSRVYTMLRDRRVEVVVMYTIDRSARDKREYPLEFLVFLSDVQDAGAELHFTDTGRSDGGILDLFKAWQAAEERRKIRERTMRGKLAKAKAGKWVGGVVPYGYCRVGRGKDNKLVIDESAAATVRCIFSLYCGDKRMPLLEIKHALENANIPSPKGCAIWNRLTIRRILKREAYVGVFYYKEIRIDLSELAIIEPELLKQAAARLEQNKRLAKRNRKRQYLLSGRFKCACGYSIIGQRGGSKGETRKDGTEYLYYHCASNMYDAIGRRACPHSRYIPTIKLDPIVWGYLEQLVTDPQALSAGIDEMNRKKESSIEPKKRRLAAVEADFVRTERKMQRLITELGDEESDTIRELTKVELKRLAQAHDTLKAEADKLTREIEEGRFTQADKKAVQVIMDKIKHRVGDATFEQKREVLDFFDVQAKLVKNESGLFVRVECGLTVEAKDLLIEERASTSSRL